MAKVHGSPDRKRWAFHCVACDRPHVFDERWKFNDNVDNPTFDPSLKLSWTEGEEKKPMVCHLVMQSGRIHYCSDCTHGRASTIADMVEWDPLHPLWNWGDRSAAKPSG